jgi:hypothetical protein
VDRAAIERLITALTRVLGTAPASTGPDPARVVGVPGLEFVESRPFGGAWVLDGLWHRLEIDTLLRRLAAGTRRDPIVERVLVALVANRALARRQSWPPPRGSPTTYTSRAQTVSDDAYYRAMDWLIAVEPQPARGMFNAVADLQPRGRSDLSSTPPAPTSRPKTRFFGKHEYGFDTPPIYRGVQGAYSKPDKLPAFPRVKDNLE